MKTCCWCIGFRGNEPVFCHAKATQHDPESPGSLLCDDHADDYVEVFGPGCLRDFPEDPE